MPARTRTRTLAAALAAATGLAAAAAAGAVPAAHAAPITRSFDFETGIMVTDGRAHTWGTVTFTARKATLSGRLNDVCPGDGDGAYLWMRVHFDNGSERSFYAKDVNGCKDRDGVAIALSVSGNGGVKGIGLYLDERDADKSSPTGTDQTAYLYVDNPRR